MIYTVQKCMLIREYNLYIYKLRCNGEYMVSSVDEKQIMNIFKEFCLAKTAATLHDETTLIVCQYYCQKGHYRLTKRYDWCDQVTYKIWKKGWFGVWVEKASNRTHSIHADYALERLADFVMNGEKEFYNDETVVASC